MNGGKACLGVQEEDPGVLGLVAFADAYRKLEVEEEWLACLGFGLNEQGTDGHVVHHATETAFQRTTAARHSQRDSAGEKP